MEKVWPPSFHLVDSSHCCFLLPFPPPTGPGAEAGVSPGQREKLARGCSPQQEQKEVTGSESPLPAQEWQEFSDFNSLRK